MKIDRQLCYLKVRKLFSWVLVTIIFGTASLSSFAAVSLADQPLTTATSVPGNLLLTLSVEFPTAISSSYKAATTPYVTSKAFIGYFDSNKCYRYIYDSGTPSNGYFKPSMVTANHTCVSSAINPLWSGNWLNWAAMQTIDSFRAALTGGYRNVDNPNMTILEKAWGSNQGSEGNNAPNKTINTVSVAGATPFTFSSAKSQIFSLGNRLRIYGPSAPNNPTITNYAGQNSYRTIGDPLQASAADVYDLVIRVQVCDPTSGLEANCTQYGANYKPEGLMQQYATKIRYGAFGYLNDGDINRDGGVLRAPMKFVGPVKTVPGQANAINTATEWSASSGIFLRNPDINDAAASNVIDSGVLNYLNKFGEFAQSYKIYDPIGEMYYAAIRYYKHQVNVPAYSNLGSDTNVANSYKDGFPVITNWVDPILYSCQKNFILGIGDTNTHRDANLPGSTIRGNEPTMPAEVAGDNTIDVTTATNKVGIIEGISNFGPSGLGTANPSWCCNQNTFFMAGLAYDAHTKDIREHDFIDPINLDSNGKKIFTQTISTFWLDVLESGYQNKNQFYLATKYGGFKVPTGFSPYSDNNSLNTLAITGASSTTPLADNMWHNNSDTYGSDLRPDNYYDASAADKMVVGLRNAFANIASQLQETTTAFSATSSQISIDGSVTYQARYDSTAWTGDLIANNTIFNNLGNPTSTAIWSAKALLNAQSSRRIVTCCTIGGAGLPFQLANLAGSVLNPRTNYLTFANVPGVALTSQSVDNYIAYLRGIRTMELAQTGGVYRNRASLLGDIVGSKIAAVGPPPIIYNENSNPGYQAFRTSLANRKTVVYVGSNDGMLHAFDGSSTVAAGGGTELFAYIPSFVYGDAVSAPVSGLASLGASSFVHHNMVDQTPAAFDINLARTGGATGTTPNWRTVLIGGLGKGGKGYYALDITNPSTWTSESAVAGKVLWEFTDPDMGYSYGPPNVFKTKKYGWVVAFTSGYNNANGVGYFFLVNPANGVLLEKISTGFGSPGSSAGLTEASSYVASFADRTADALYAGDLYGNVWRLDLTGLSGNYPAPTKIAELRDSNGNPQPITTRPLIEIQRNTFKRYVLIGTGRLLDNSDILNSQTQSFYAIGDGGVNFFYNAATLPSGRTFPIHRNDMNANTALLTGIGASPVNPLGWYYDLSMTSNGSAERINIDPAANFGTVVFAANLPNGDACSPSGTNRVFAVNLGTGQSVLTDTNGQRIQFSSLVTGVATEVGFISLNRTPGSNSTGVSGTRIIVGGSNGDPASAGIGNYTSTPVQQINWRELPSAD